MKALGYIMAVVLIFVGVFGGLALAAWVGGYLMLYRGIIGAVHATTASEMAGSIIKAIFFEGGVATGFVGALFVLAGKELWKKAERF